jgi:uncharacterized tellurite resistance protein B-like protein
MHDQNMAILKGLVAVAWADGRVAEEEVEVIEALLDAFDATPSERTEIRRYSDTPRTLEDIPLTDLSFDDRRVLLQHAVLLSYIDGEQHVKEKQLLDRLCSKLNIPDAEAQALMTAAEQRATELLHVLESTEDQPTA